MSLAGGKVDDTLLIELECRELMRTKFKLSPVTRDDFFSFNDPIDMVEGVELFSSEQVEDYSLRIKAARNRMKR